MTSAFTLPITIALPTSHTRAATSRRKPLRLSVASPPPSLRPSGRGSPPEPVHSPTAEPLIGTDALSHVLATAPSDRLVVVMFHARWCRVCKTLSAKLERIALDFPGLVWLSVDFAEMPNKPLCAQLGVKLLPTFRFYRPRADVDTALDHFTTGPFGVKRLVEHLEKQRSTGLLGDL